MPLEHSVELMEQDATPSKTHKTLFISHQTQRTYSNVHKALSHLVQPNFQHIPLFCSNLVSNSQRAKDYGTVGQHTPVCQGPVSC